MLLGNTANVSMSLLINNRMGSYVGLQVDIRRCDVPTHWHFACHRLLACVDAAHVPIQAAPAIRIMAAAGYVAPIKF